MLKVAMLQIKKIFCQKKGWFALIGMNAVPVVMFLFTAFILIYKVVSKGELNMVVIMGYSFKQSTAHDLLLIQYATFILSSLFFTAMLWGEIVSKEFYNRTIKIELLSPHSRLSIFLGKFLGIFLFYIFSFLAGLILIQVINAACLWSNGAGLFSMLVKIMYPMEIFSVCILGLVIISFTAMISSFASSIEMCIGLGVFLNIFQLLADSIMYALHSTGDISSSAYSWLKYSWIQSFSQVFKFAIQLTRNTKPVITEIVKINIYVSAGWCVFFLALGYILFHRREI